MLRRLKLVLALASVPIWTLAFALQGYSADFLLTSSLVLSSSVLVYTARKKRTSKPLP